MTATAISPLEPDTLWKAAQEILKLEVTQQQFHSYVTLARIDHDIAQGSLKLLVPSETAANWLRSNLLLRIEELVGKPHGLDVTISAVNEDDLFSQVPPAKPKAANGAPRSDSAKVTTANAVSEPSAKGRAGLSSEFLFENFVSGPSNEMAYAAALKLATEKGTARLASPLFIHGSVGLGKTHLAHALGNRFLMKNPGSKVRVLSGEQFMREVQASFLSNNVQSFRTSYRRLDMLILDDIQLIGRDSEQTHKQFLALFNYMTENNLPVVITSDRPVRQLNRNLPARLLSRLGMGLDVIIANPDLDTRVAILRCQCEALLSRELPEETAFVIAKRLRNNCRELIGALRRIGHYVDFRGIELTPEAAATVLKENEVATMDLDPHMLIRHVAEHYGLRQSDLQCKRRTQRLVHARHVAMFLCRELTEISLPEIGSHFSCHHSSVLHACRKIASKLHEEPSFSSEVNQLRQELTS